MTGTQKAIAGLVVAGGVVGTVTYVLLAKPEDTEGNVEYVSLSWD